MLSKYFLIVSIIVINFNSYSQFRPSKLFKNIDKKHAFKDVAFKTHIDSLITKMGLKKTVSAIGTVYYLITEEKYKSVGKYNASAAWTEFSKGKLYSIRLRLDVEFSEALTYFSSVLGTPGKLVNDYSWIGNNLIYNIWKIDENGKSKTDIFICTLQLERDNKEDNF